MGGVIKYVNILISSAFWGQKNKKLCIKHTQIKNIVSDFIRKLHPNKLKKNVPLPPTP